MPVIHMILSNLQVVYDFLQLSMHIYHGLLFFYYIDFEYIYGVTQTTTLQVTSDIYLTLYEFMPLYATQWLLIILCRPVYAMV